MILPIAALLLQIAAIPANSAAVFPKATAEVSRIAPSEAASKAAGNNDGSPVRAGIEEVPPAPESPDNAAPVSNPKSGTAFARVITPPAAVSLSKSDPHGAGEKSHGREWIALAIAEHSAAAFDAWSTRRALSTGDARELNPTLRPFASNSSLYAATQVGPALLDFVSRRMMSSQRHWERRTWWILQTVSAATSFASGAHNLTIH